MPSKPGIRSKLSNGEQRESVQRGLSNLTADHKHLLEMAYFQGMTQSEIAAHLGRPLGTVKTQIRSAMRKLAEIMVQTPTDQDSSNVFIEEANDRPLRLFGDHPGSSNRV